MAVGQARSWCGRRPACQSGSCDLGRGGRIAAELKGAIIIVEEASQVGTRDLGRIVRLANMTDARVIQTGDARQLGAISAGKPFEASQQAGVATAYVTENLRSRSETMKAVTTAFDEKNLSAGGADSGSSRRAVPSR
ncbi:AAA family ATPase [Sphingomonas sp. 37zxx]|uniref:AAA family ATPase n=1 Tax=Sphingomonas sp. 37zxx TaxID=1550073 RepID=UPI00053BE67C|nr:AAA family ATPase [Sphingomonas sp. 37zxx]